MSRDRLARRFLGLAWGEAASALIFAAIYVQLQRQAQAPFGPAVLSAFALLEFILLQGALYWALGLRRVRRGLGVHPPGVLGAYRLLRLLNALLLIAVLGALWWRPVSPLAALALWLFALVEFVNYFLVRLSYPLPQFLARLSAWHFPPSLLARELRRGR